MRAASKGGRTAVRRCSQANQVPSPSPAMYAVL